MKKLAHYDLDKIFEFSGDRVNTLIVESPELFRELITELHRQINEGQDGKFMFSKDETTLDPVKSAELIAGFVPFEINRKNLLTKICTSAEKNAVNESNYLKTQQLLADIESYLDSLLFDYSYSFGYEKLNITSLIKSVGLCIDDCYENELEKILDYMKLIREFDKDKIFVFVNMRSYFSCKDITLFASDVITEGFDILLIDNREYDSFDGETRTVIDKDLCEIF